MDANVRKKLCKMEVALFKAPRRRMFASDSWAHDIPPEPGVYAIWEANSKVPVYVGESSGLRSRMSDIGRSVNHTFRRKIAKILKVGSGDEAVLTKAMSKRYEISFIEVELGRVELEEYLVLRWRETLLNKPAKRPLHGKRYNWVEPAIPARN